MHLFPLRRRWLQQILPFWMLTLTVGSFLPDQIKQTLQVQSPVMDPGKPPWRHCVWHMLAFGTSALLVSLVNRNTKLRFVFCSSVLLLGVGIEYTQSMVSASDLEWWDIRDDAYGIITFWVLGQARAIRQALMEPE